MSFRKWMKLLVLLTALALLPLGGLATEGEIPFDVTVTWVFGAGQPPQDLMFEYQFVNSLTMEEIPLLVSAKDHPVKTGDNMVVKANAEISLPKLNSDGSQAVYHFHPLPASLAFDGIHYAVSSAQSLDPAAGAPYTSRALVLTQQLVPQVKVSFDGVEARPFSLTLEMASWAQGADQANTHQATVQVDSVGETGINLHELFSQNPSDMVLFRYFTLVDLRYDGATIAGHNTFTLKVEELPGITTEVTGTPQEGFQIVLKAGQ